MYTLRPYQQAAHDAVIDWIKTCLDPRSKRSQAAR